ncbi:heme oxygenase [Oceanobacillus saliphilus]|uniref:heme oxygenase n=1 Tax=Oceanobacillus saliphilus TaxID=2925834 RepID=UPI00201DDA44|nr:heme oxygenase [Oceanobacillus saliphilus]
MFIVTNRIKTKKGMAAKMAPAFTKPGLLQKMEGFHKVEVLVTQNIEEYDELNVNMYWENLENFTSWRNSDHFREAHQGSKPDQEKESPIIGSKLIISELASTIKALPEDEQE